MEGLINAPDDARLMGTTEVRRRSSSARAGHADAAAVYVAITCCCVTQVRKNKSSTTNTLNNHIRNAVPNETAESWPNMSALVRRSHACRHMSLGGVKQRQQSRRTGAMNRRDTINMQAGTSASGNCSHFAAMPLAHFVLAQRGQLCAQAGLVLLHPCDFVLQAAQ